MNRPATSHEQPVTSRTIPKKHDASHHANGEPGIVLGITIDERHGDRWHVRLERDGRVATYRAEECRVLDRAQLASGRPQRDPVNGSS